MDLSNCNAKVGVLEGLLTSCVALQKLSLKGCNVTSGMVHSICRVPSMYNVNKNNDIPR